MPRCAVGLLKASVGSTTSHVPTPPRTEGQSQGNRRGTSPLTRRRKVLAPGVQERLAIYGQSTHQGTTKRPADPGTVWAERTSNGGGMNLMQAYRLL